MQKKNLAYPPNVYIEFLYKDQNIYMRSCTGVYRTWKLQITTLTNANHADFSGSNFSLLCYHPRLEDDPCRLWQSILNTTFEIPRSSFATRSPCDVISMSRKRHEYYRCFELCVSNRISVWLCWWQCTWRLRRRNAPQVNTYVILTITLIEYYARNFSSSNKCIHHLLLTWKNSKWNNLY